MVLLKSAWTSGLWPKWLRTDDYRLLYARMPTQLAYHIYIYIFVSQYSCFQPVKLWNAWKLENVLVFTFSPDTSYGLPKFGLSWSHHVFTPPLNYCLSKFKNNQIQKFWNVWIQGFLKFTKGVISWYIKTQGISTNQVLGSSIILNTVLFSKLVILVQGATISPSTRTVSTAWSAMFREEPRIYIITYYLIMVTLFQDLP